MEKVIYKLFLVVFIIASTSNINAQQIDDYADVKLETTEDFEKAKNIIQDATKYILSNPANQNDIKRFQALQLIMTWMEGYPGYTFSFESIDKLGKDIDAKAAYIAAIAHYYLDNENSNPDTQSMKVGSWKLFLKYAENPNNKIKNTRSIKKLLSASKISDSSLANALQ